MEWRNRRESENVEDVGRGARRSIGVFGFKGGIGTLILALVLWKVFGINPATIMNIGQQMQSNAPMQTTAPQERTGHDLVEKQFVSTILADTEDTWGQIFQAEGATYQPPKMVLFSGATQSACGAAESSMGPFYCPADQKVYLDTAFFTEMRSNLGMKGEQANSGEAANNEAGDFAQAYVIAHEVGHHVQNLMGISGKVQEARQRTNDRNANQLSVRLELQADCFAGVWASHTQQRIHFLQQGDLEEAMDAATKVGDDHIQATTRGYVNQETFTHGSGAQRMQWFNTGFSTGKLDACDTFS